MTAQALLRGALTVVLRGWGATETAVQDYRRPIASVDYVGEGRMNVIVDQTRIG